MYYLGLGDENLMDVDLDRCGRMSVADLERKIKLLQEKNVPLLGVVGVIGTTELGTVDPAKPIADMLEELKLKNGQHIWFHLDAAYGGFFRSLVESAASHTIDTDLLENLNSMSRADSVTLDPHKLGYVPYASGAFVCKNHEDYFMKSFTGPYIVSDRHNLGNFTIEGSRSAAGAVATYASMKSFSGSDGYARILRRTLLAKNIFKDELEKSGIRILFPEGTDTNILCFSVLSGKKSLSKINLSNLNLYEKIHSDGRYWISKTTLNRSHFTKLIDKNCEMNAIDVDSEEMVLLRLTLMNPFVSSKEGSMNHAENFADLIANHANN
jgi:glutamate/tyrosine decarboxylase-like PLP-dependent enzyme